MRKNQEKLLVAALCGMVIASAAAFAVQPAMASGYFVDSTAQVTGISQWDKLNVRKWPASFSQQVGALSPNVHVWVDRCVISPQGGADWCLVERGVQKGWVNASYLTLANGH